MEHKGTVRIETERLILRQFTEGDIEAAFRNWTSDDRVTEFLRWPTHTAVTVTDRVVRSWVDEYKDSAYWVLHRQQVVEMWVKV